MRLREEAECGVVVDLQFLAFRNELFESLFRLSSRLHDGIGGLFAPPQADPAGIDQRERSAAPFGLGTHTVARDARLVVHDGDAPTGDAVEQRRFPDVWPPDDGNQT